MDGGKDSRLTYRPCSIQLKLLPASKVYTAAMQDAVLMHSIKHSLDLHTNADLYTLICVSWHNKQS